MLQEATDELFARDPAGAPAVETVPQIRPEADQLIAHAG
jgi:hypothetical protein